MVTIFTEEAVMVAMAADMVDTAEVTMDTADTEATIKKKSDKVFCY